MTWPYLAVFVEFDDEGLEVWAGEGMAESLVFCLGDLFCYFIMEELLVVDYDHL